jgi:hypothetical protein
MPDDDLDVDDLADNGEDDADDDGDEDASEENGDADDEGYVFVSTGESCPQCEALDGTFFQVVPERPHDKCDCEIRFTRLGTRQSSENCENEWDIGHVGNTHYGSGGYGVITHSQITVYCWDGAVFDTIADVDHGDDASLVDQDWEVYEAEAWNDLYDEAEEIAGQNCSPDCGPPLIS